ncbi:MAG: TRAP transporter substrate-binding protein DctP [Deltaproteobacteria bacterium]|jgi:TRAP-type transport system periplasmic protein|nr:TRAP transporter substrate-binding protein DctP [Deltaproteobacteria bacterium]
MRLKKLIACLSVVALMVVVMGVSSPGRAEAAEITLNMGHPFPEKLETLTSWEKWFAAEIEKRTNGKVKIKIFWSQSLGKTSDLPDLVQSGGVDMTMLVPGYYPARFPLAMASNQLWFVNWTNDEAFAVAKALYWVDPIKNELAKQNMKLIYIQVLPKYQLWNWAGLKNIADLKGKKIRSWGPYMPKLYEAVGAVGVNLVQADWFEAMQKHMIDGGFFSVSMGLASKVDEVAKYVTMVDLGINTGPMCIMNQDKWNSLPADVKKVFQEVMAEMPAVGKQLTIDAENAGIKAAKAKGLTLVPFPDRQKWIDALPDIRAIWAEDMAKKGLGKEAQQMIKLWNAALESVRKK